MLSFIILLLREIKNTDVFVIGLMELWRYFCLLITDSA